MVTRAQQATLRPITNFVQSGIDNRDGMAAWPAVPKLWADFCMVALKMGGYCSPPGSKTH
jgi:hypothetical protein